MICYAVLAHREPALVERLARQLGVDGSTVLLHVDRHQPLRRFAGIPARVPGVTLLEPRIAVRWARFSLVAAALFALRQALANPDWTHVVLLSGQDYPIKPAPERAALFAGHEGRSFVQWSTGDAEPVDRTGNLRWYWDGDDYRLVHPHWWVAGRPVHAPNRFVPWWPRMRPPEDFSKALGSQWVGLHRDAARWILDTVERRPDVVRYFRRVFVPDECFFPMLLLGSPFAAGLVNDDLHHIDWDGWHPRLLTGADLPALRASPKLFARKFSLDADPLVLDTLDAELLTPAGAS